MRIGPFLCFAVAAVMTTGCADDGARPPDAAPLFYPLTLGNAWLYDYTLIILFYDVATGKELRADTLTGTGDVRLTGEETISDTPYLIETTTIQADTASDTSWVRLRQDDNGLYRALVPTNLPPAITSPSTPPTELTRLRYPLQPGAEWTIYTGPPTITATVEALDTLTTPGGTFAAYRVAVRASDDGPDDWIRIWYTRSGKIHEIRHNEVIAVDPSTNTQTRIITEEIEVLTQVTLEN